MVHASPATFGRRSTLVFALASAALLACTRHEPPAPDWPTPSSIPLSGERGASVPARIEGDAGLAGETLPVTSSDAGAIDASPADATTVASSTSDEAAALPQTRDKPNPSGPAFEARVKGLWEAIVHDDPERAMPFFFPVKAYGQVKAIPRPESDWKHRLVGAYARDIHALHKKLGDAPESATFVRFEVPAGGGRWVEPDEETNKIGYYRVYGTRLHFQVGGQDRSFEVKSLISWRGEWYVVHLSGFK
jgi:hypothetical protein